MSNILFFQPEWYFFEADRREACAVNTDECASYFYAQSAQGLAWSPDLASSSREVQLCGILQIFSRIIKDI